MELGGDPVACLYVSEEDKGIRFRDGIGMQTCAFFFWVPLSALYLVSFLRLSRAVLFFGSLSRLSLSALSLGSLSRLCVWAACSGGV